MPPDELTAVEAALNQGDLDGARRLLVESDGRSPRHAEAWYYLGSMLIRAGRDEQAAAAIACAIVIAGDFFEGVHDLAVLTSRMGKPAEALPLFDRALRQKANHPFPWLNRGVAFEQLGRFEEARSSYRKAAELKPDYVEAWCNLGNAACRLNRLDEGLESYRRALSIDPSDADSLYGRSLALLAQGHFGEGFALFEHLWKKSDAEPPRHATIPRWLGSTPLQGKRILLWSEQGYGDTLQFCRYAALVARLGAEVTLEVQPGLVELLAGLGCPVVAKGGSQGAFDFQAPLLSLPLAFNTTLDSVPANVPYLKATPDRIETWKRHLGPRAAKPRIGIACSGRATHKNDRQRSASLAAFAPLLDLAELYVVQTDLREEDRATLTSQPGMRFLGGQLRDFADAAALIEALDLVITVDTSLAHLSGALAKPTCLLLPLAAEWRWLLERRDSPWYPATRLFRQQQAGDWSTVIRDVAEFISRPGRS